MRNTFRFAVIILCPLMLAHCTNKPQLQSTRWSGLGQSPVLSEVGIRKQIQLSSNSQKVELNEQYLEGFKVQSAFAKRVYDREGNLIFQSSHLLPALSRIQILKARRLDERKDKVWQDFLQNNSTYKELKIFAEPKVVFAPTASIQVRLEERNGELLQLLLNENSQLLSFNKLGSQFSNSTQVQAFAFPQGPQKSQLTTIQYFTSQWLAVTSQSPLNLPEETELDFHPPDERFDQVQVYYFAEKYLQWLKNKLQVQLDIPLQIQTHTGYPQKTNTAFYFQNKVRLGTGDGVVYANMMWDPSIVLHEVSHGLIDQLASLPFEGEGGSINEGFADYFTCSYLQTSVLGDQSYQRAAYKRTVDQELTIKDRTGGLYHDSAIVSGFFWALQKQLGQERSLQFAMLVLNRLGPNTDFADFQKAVQEIAANSSDSQKIQLLVKGRLL